MKSEDWAVAVAALAAWGTLILDFSLGVNSVDGWGGAVENHVLYFTLWTNTLVAVSLTAGVWASRRGRAGFWSDANTLTALTTSMIIVALVYNVMLRHGHVVRGAYRITNEMTHVVLPVIFALYWWRFAKREQLSRRRVLLWTGYLLLYGAYLLIQGEFTGRYPYYFADPTKIGWLRVAGNALVLLVVFAGINLALTRLAKRFGNRR